MNNYYSIPKEKMSFLRNVFKLIINDWILKKLGFEIVNKARLYRSEQRCLTVNKEVLKIRNDRICSVLQNFGSNFGLNFNKSERWYGLQ